MMAKCPLLARQLLDRCACPDSRRSPFGAVEDRGKSEKKPAGRPRFYASSPFFSSLLAPSYTSSRMNATIQPSKDALDPRQPASP